MLNRIWARGQVGLVKQISTSGNLILDLEKSNNFKIILTGNLLLDNPVNIIEGQSGAIVFVQDATGNRTVTFGSSWKWSDGIVDNITLLPNSISILMYYTISNSLIYTSIATDIK